MEEIWADIKGFEGLYQISNFKRVKSLSRIEQGHCSNGKYNSNYYRKERILKPHKCKEYYQFTLYKDGKKYYKQRHILLAEAFIPNPENKPVVDHIIPIKNGGTDDIENLRWATTKENCNNENTLKNKLKSISLFYKKVKCSNDIETLHFESIVAAAKHFNMKSIATITNCLCGRAKTGYGYKWQYDTND